MSKQKVYSILSIVLILLVTGGIIDSAYLTYEHFSNTIPPCSTGLFVDCGKVLSSQYSLLFGIPLALLGLVHYTILFFLLAISLSKRNQQIIRLVFLQTAIGFIFSLYLVGLQLFIIKSICLYCMVSALISFTLYFLVRKKFWSEYQKFFIIKQGFVYRQIVKPIFFLLDPEFVHNNMVRTGEFIGSIPVKRKLIHNFYSVQDKRLEQKIAGITFRNPLGLAAGFDYEARLTQILPVLNFGFQTVGTVTNLSYEGNAKPRLGRLPQSKSLMVNKGFKTEGAEMIINKLMGKKFAIPVGISIGRTNTDHTSQTEAIKDIISTFEKFENSSVRHSYYELNISCPNLKADISFYPTKNLHELLSEIENLHIKRPIFVKMPIEKSDSEVLSMLEVIAKFNYTGVIIGNLQKNRKDPAFVPAEVNKWKTGNFSGKPTWQRSNELIRLVYNHYHDKMVIIGCGGVFTPEDAYTKIKYGASLVQLITGMIYQGPQIMADINLGLLDLIRRDGLKHISQVIGADSK